MINERSAGAVIFRREGDRILYLLLHYRYKTEYWDFPRGNIEEGEGEQETLKREVQEETGIEDIAFVKGFTEGTDWFYKREGETVYKEVTYFLVETKTKGVRISEEHIGYEWLPYSEALERIGYRTSKEILEKANSFLTENPTLTRFFK
jgi:8-oxo-dGTP pyrophosphatase MutT (NUDIX family)